MGVLLTGALFVAWRRARHRENAYLSAIEELEPYSPFCCECCDFCGMCDEEDLCEEHGLNY